MNNFLTSLYLSVFQLPEGRIKDAIRNKFYGDVVTERIVEYSLVFSHLNKEPSKKIKVLDIGCYYSNFPLQLASMGYDVTAIDLMDYQLSHPYLKFIKGDITSYQFSKNSFDIVTCISTLEHIGIGYYQNDKENKRGDELAVEAIWKILRKKGRFILTVPFGVKSVNSLQRVYDWKNLNKLLYKYSIRETLFYKEDSGKWKLTTRAIASKIKSNKKTSAIAFLVCEKVSK